MNHESKYTPKYKNNNRIIEAKKNTKQTSLVGGDFSDRLRAYRDLHAHALFSSLGRLIASRLNAALTIIVLAISISLACGFYLLIQNVQQLTSDLESSNQISLFLRDDVSLASANRLANGIKLDPSVQAVKVITKEQALKEFEDFSGFGEAVRALEKNPLPIVLQVIPKNSLEDGQNIETLVENFKQAAEVDFAQLDMQWVKRLQLIIEVGQRSVALMGILLSFAVLFAGFCNLAIIRYKYYYGLSRENRILYGGREKLYECLASQPLAGGYVIEIRDDQRRGHIGRKANIEIRYCKVKIARPKNLTSKSAPKFIELTAIEARERVGAEESIEPVLWRLLTTHHVPDVSVALQMVEWYKTRWLIEEVFRLLKNQGLNIEDSQLQSGKALKSLAILGLQAVLRILQLRQDRDGLCSMQASVTFSPDEIEFAKLVGKHHIKSTTPLQSNPFDECSLAWIGWIIARLGGWKGYRSTASPGVITLKRGMQKFDQMFQGFLIIRNLQDVYKE